jgi:hypothetical protein
MSRWGCGGAKDNAQRRIPHPGSSNPSPPVLDTIARRGLRFPWSHFVRLVIDW